MERQKKYILNSILLSAVSVVIRAVTVSFNAYVTRKIGTEAVGLFTLVMSVYTFAVTLAVSGVNLAAVRITSKRLALCEARGYDGATTRRIMRRDMTGCAVYSLFFGLLSGILLYSLSEQIGVHVLADIRTVSSLRLLAAALPAISLSSALAGYFTGLRKIYKNAIVTLTEQFIKITITSAALIIIAPKGVEYACLAVVGGSAAAEGGSMITSFLLYITDKTKSAGKKSDAELPRRISGLKSVIQIAFPVALGSYVRQGLTCAEHVAIPRGLRKFGSDSAAALSSYGVLQGMTLPLILFPSSVTSAFSSLLIPELSEFSALGQKQEIAKTAERAVSFCMTFSIGAAAIFVTFGHGLGLSVYGNTDAGKYIVFLAALVPIMYLDTTVDSILKGMGEQLYCMKVNILDASLSLIIVMLLVPRMGVMGYVVCIYTSECINAALSIGKTISVTNLRFRASWILRPALTAAILCLILRFITGRIYIGGTAVEIAVFAALYTVLMLPKSKDST
ncbi:MAG: oligosaccharide flippase family protein [Clostridia bacterium]|nr:oligosaccharide flippase family protein [Clostridia bacterium]